jgi:oxygen-independent coproporphyrinogen-3 oxidase
VDGWRWHNVASTAEFVMRVQRQQVTAVSEPVRLPDHERVAEALFMGLRLSEGVEVGTFRARFGVEPWETYELALAPFEQGGVVGSRDGRFGLTRRGMLVANEILAAFV